MDKVRSSDGTTIAFDRLGVGAPVILVSGASTSRAVHTRLAELLAADFTVFNTTAGDAATAATPRHTGSSGRSRTSRPCSPKPAGRRRCSATPPARSSPCTRPREGCP